MSIWQDFVNALFPRTPETRARVVPPAPIGEPITLTWDGWGTTDTSGDKVSPSTAIRNPSVLACVRVLSESVASLPLKLYRMTPAGKDVATDHPLHSVLHDMANTEMTSFELRETLMANVLLWGNAYCEIEMNGRADVLGLWPLPPDRTWPQRHADGSLWYHTRGSGGAVTALPSYRVWHVRGLSTNGVLGLSPITLAREAVGLSNAGETAASRYFTNGARPGGVISHPGKLSPQAAKNLSTTWNEAHQGLSNTSRVAILEEGMKWSDTGMPWKDAQFLETRQFQAEEIARIFRVPQHMIGILTHATFSNIEHQAIEFVVHSLRPWLVRLEQSISRDLIGVVERKTLSPSFIVDGLLRGDTASRFAAYAIARQWGWMSPNDVRTLENLNPIDGGDQYLTPLNMGTLGEPPPPDAQPAPRAVRLLVEDACQRIAERAADHNAKHGAWIAGVLAPLGRALHDNEADAAKVAMGCTRAWLDTPEMTASELADLILK
jgi:HK97 family phage portal protein